MLDNLDEKSKFPCYEKNQYLNMPSVLTITILQELINKEISSWISRESRWINLCPSVYHVLLFSGEMNIQVKTCKHYVVSIN